MKLLKIIASIPKVISTEHDSFYALKRNAARIFRAEGFGGLFRAVLRTFKTTKEIALPLEAYDSDTSGSGTGTKDVSQRNSEKKLIKRDEYFDQLFSQASSEQPENVPISNHCVELGDDDVKVIAYYLPQFHPFPENDLWWGKGFTEWTNVSKAVPQFVGHYQPRLPGELGFYDLRMKEVQERQIQLAQQYGIYGFCYHHYWFAGKRLMEKPVNRVMEDPDLKFPFCLCWANENWTRRWDGAEHDILIAQDHSPEDDLAFIADIEPALKNQYYIRIDGKPLIIVYRVSLLPDAAATAERWREYCHRVGIGDIYLVVAQSFGITDPKPYGFDAAVEFPPHKVYAPGLNSVLDIVNPEFEGRIFDYRYLVDQSKSINSEEFPLYHTVMPSWDNEARKPGKGHVFHNASPALYQEWLTNTCRHTCKIHKKDKYVFLNAWNEWAEGAYLEPDRRYGYAHLQATSNAILATRSLSDTEPLISVIVPSYNHEKYIYASLKSVADQTYRNLEIIVVNDGSQDKTEAEVKRFIADHPKMKVVYNYQKNNGSRSAIEAGVLKARGQYIAILNSDDIYESERFNVLLHALNENNSCFAFSNVSFIDSEGSEFLSDDEYINNVKLKMDGIGDYGNIVYALLDSNVTVSTGNFLFARWLYDALGGFSEHELVHDWSFVLRATFLTRPVFVKDRLYRYRVHETNTYKSLDDRAVVETDSVLKDFFSRYKTNYTLFRKEFDSEFFQEFIEGRGYGKYKFSSRG